MNEKVVTRFAPSPTGFMHVGNVRSALYAWLWTRKNNGKFILRIEDTDKAREVAGSLEHIVESLKWLGVTWDEGIEVGGSHGPYLQSERLDIYRHYAQKMIDKGLAYPDPYTAEELEAFRKKAEEEKRPFLYRDHRPETFEVWDGTKPLRFKTPVIKSYAWHDVVFGDLSAGPEALDDFIMIKADGYPTYNFAHIVDDLEMGITLVMRGQEYISSTPKYLSVYEALGIEPPVYACLPHILATGGQKKLGKRDGAKDILEYRNEGFLPDAMINFLVLIGWNPGTDQEIFTREELINIFEIDRIQHAGGTLSDDKLLWCNKEHLNKLSMDEFRNYLEPALEIARLKPGFNEEMFDRIIPTIRERISVRSEFVDMIENGELGYLFSNPGKSTRESAWKNSTPEIAKVHIESLLELLGNYEGSWDVESLKTVVMPYAEQSGKGDVLWPLRFILTGLEKSPDPFTVMYILGKDETIHRLNTSLEL